MKKFTKQLMAFVAVVVAGMSAQAQVTTDPYLFEAPSLGAADGTFEWDTFAGSFAGPHATDVGTTGTGIGSLNATGFTPLPMDGPPFGLITSSTNLYSGGTSGIYSIDLAGLDASEAFTTVVLQIAYVEGLGPFAQTLQLDGVDPTERLDCGTAPGVLHGIVQSPNDTTYLWAEWQVAAGQDHTLTFDSLNHTNVAAVRIDYINDASVVDALAPQAVPEPTGLAMLLGGAVLFGTRRRR